MRSTVCLIGRPNTGKSSLFNRLIKEKKAIVDNTPGVTRDRLYGIVNYKDKSFNLIDTGGLDLEQLTFSQNIKMQAEIAIDESDVIVFVIDGKESLTTNDYYIRDMLLKFKKKIIVAINKIDDKCLEDRIYEYYELGFEKMITVSAEHKRNIDILLDMITEDFTPITENIKDSLIKFSIIGRPNTGKSSLVNALLGCNRQIVSDISGTTLDSNDTRFTYNHDDYVVIDTAGMRKKGKIYENIEKYSLIRSLKAIERSDVCVLVLDAKTGIIEHDKHIVSYVLDSKKALVLVVNKWDLVSNKDIEMKKWKKKIEQEFQFIPYVNVLFLSAKNKTRIHTLMPEIINSYKSYTQEIKTSSLNDCIRDAVFLHPAPSYKGNRLKIYYVHQEGSMPPKFVFHVNNKKLIHFSYQRYLENKIRESFNLVGTPIEIKFKNRDEE